MAITITPRVKSLSVDIDGYDYWCPRSVHLTTTATITIASLLKDFDIIIIVLKFILLSFIVVVNI